MKKKLRKGKQVITRKPNRIFTVKELIKVEDKLIERYYNVLDFS